MKIYLVGGAVRDELLGLPVKEKDYCVVGATADELIQKGFKPVGKEFPVFLHPDTHEEYALARTERKSGSGHKGFECFASPKVTIEEDLLRRDLTINAIAKDEAGNLIDPHGGQADIKAKILRHVSDAFAEDPLRVLRVARFKAQLSDFSVAPETITEMIKIVQSGEMNTLSGERIFKELSKALETQNTQAFLDVLDEIKFQGLACKKIELPGFEELTSELKFCALFHKHLDALPFNPPAKWKDLASLLFKFKTEYGSITTNKEAKNIVKLLGSLDIKRRYDRFEKWLVLCELLTQNNKSKDMMEKYAEAYLSVNDSAIAKNCENPAEIKSAILREQVRAVETTIGEI